MSFALKRIQKTNFVNRPTCFRGAATVMVLPGWLGGGGEIAGRVGEGFAWGVSRGNPLVSYTILSIA